MAGNPLVPGDKAPPLLEVEEDVRFREKSRPWVFNGDYADLEQVRPFLGQYRHRDQHLRAHHLGPYAPTDGIRSDMESYFVGHVSELSGPDELIGLGLLATLSARSGSPAQGDRRG